MCSLHTPIQACHTHFTQCHWYHDDDCPSRYPLIGVTLGFNPCFPQLLGILLFHLIFIFIDSHVLDVSFIIPDTSLFKLLFLQFLFNLIPIIIYQIILTSHLHNSIGTLLLKISLILYASFSWLFLMVFLGTVFFLGSLPFHLDGLL